jgi:hypothetical protein
MTEDLVANLCCLHWERVRELEDMEAEYARTHGVDRAELRRMSSRHYMPFTMGYLRRKHSKRREYEGFLNAIPTDELRRVIALMYLGGIDEFSAPETLLSYRGWEKFPVKSPADALDFVAKWPRQSLLMTITRDEMFPVECLRRGRERLAAAGIKLEDWGR